MRFYGSRKTLRPRLPARRTSLPDCRFVVIEPARKRDTYPSIRFPRMRSDGVAGLKTTTADSEARGKGRREERKGRPELAKASPGSFSSVPSPTHFPLPDDRLVVIDFAAYSLTLEDSPDDRRGRHKARTLRGHCRLGARGMGEGVLVEEITMPPVVAYHGLSGAEHQ